MWFPNSIQIPKELIQAELNGEAPSGSTLAIAAFILTNATDMTAKSVLNQYALDRSAGWTAWTFLRSGEVKTETNGVKTSASDDASSTRSETTTTPSDIFESEVYNLFQKYFPNELGPTSAQYAALYELVKNDKNYVAPNSDMPDGLAHIDDALYQMANGGSVVKTPVVLLLWKLRNESAEKHARDRKQIEKKGPSDDAIVARVIREAEAQMQHLRAPEVNVEQVESIKAKRERIQGGRP